MKIYALRFDLLFKSFYKTKELAQKALKEKEKDIKTRATIITSTSEKFSFYYGWEGHGGTWSIIEIDVNE